MTAYPDVSDLPEVSAYVLWHIVERVSWSRSPGLQRWASAACDALLARLA
jgi:hypothetical protein